MHKSISPEELTADTAAPSRLNNETSLRNQLLIIALEGMNLQALEALFDLPTKKFIAQLPPMMEVLPRYVEAHRKNFPDKYAMDDGMKANAVRLFRGAAEKIDLR